MNPVPGPLPYRTKLEVRQWVIAMLTEIYTEGTIPDSSGGKPWTAAEIGEALACAVELWAGLARDVQGAAEEGRDPDPAAFLQRAALALAADPPTGPFPSAYIDEQVAEDPW